MDGFFERLKEEGFKLTPQRLAIAHYLEGNKDHPTASRIFQDLKPQFPSMSMATVYNTLNTMIKLGLLREYVLHKDQAHYDPDLSPHHHFCCHRCQKIWDLPQQEGLPDVKEFEEKTQNQVDHVSLVLVGVCKSCLLN